MHNLVYVVTGISGVGKSTVGQFLAKILSIDFVEGDQYHTVSNINKMRAGVPLTDQDRLPWLQALNTKIKSILHEGKSAVITCSALKQSYRDILAQGVDDDNIKWLHLLGSKDQVKEQITKRQKHFFDPALLDSQFHAFEEPIDDHKIPIGDTINQTIFTVLKELNMLSDIGVLGLGIMGTSLARNIGRNKIKLSIYNRHLENKEVDIAIGKKLHFEELCTALAFDDLDQFVLSIRRPRKIILMVNAGASTDEIILKLTELLDKGDIIIDGGNSYYKDTQRRQTMCDSKSINLVGCGISGGEQGALNGPSIMPSGSENAVTSILPYLQLIAARHNGAPCVSFIGKGASGHFVKMVHNGIEYAEMQLIAETIQLFQYLYNYNLLEIAALFKKWGKGRQRSYLLQITVDILMTKTDDGNPILSKILDVAGNKGTGSWTTMTAAELGIPIPTISDALYARYLSNDKEKRSQLHGHFDGQEKEFRSDCSEDSIEQFLYFARVMNHHQGLTLIQKASQVYNWEIDIQELIKTWRAGCIIQSHLIEDLFDQETSSADFIMTPEFSSRLSEAYLHSKNIAAEMIQAEVPFSCLLSSIDYFKSIKQRISTASIIQAQRDYFGAHTFRWTKEPEKPVHLNWQKN